MIYIVEFSLRTTSELKKSKSYILCTKIEISVQNVYFKTRFLTTRGPEIFSFVFGGSYPHKLWAIMPNIFL